MRPTNHTLLISASKLSFSTRAGGAKASGSAGLSGSALAAPRCAVRGRGSSRVDPSKGSPMEGPTLLRDLHWTPLEGSGINVHGEKILVCADQMKRLVAGPLLGSAGGEDWAEGGWNPFSQMTIVTLSV